MSMTDDDQTGAIDTSDDNSGAPPVMGSSAPPVEDDSTGVNEAQQPPASPGANGGPLNPMNVPANAKRIIAYLTGADAVHPQTIDQIGAEIDPQGQMAPGDRNVHAIDYVREKYGDNAAWQLMQANRVAYNAKAAFGTVAMKGTPQKPADLNAAIDAANKAQTHVLDGSNVQFAPAQGGVTATVTMPGSDQPQRIMLSPQAFAKFLDVGGDGQWDKIMEASAPATLQRLAQQFPMQQAPQGAPRAGAAPQKKPLLDLKQVAAEHNAQQPQTSASPPGTTYGHTPSSMNLSGSEEAGKEQPAPDTGIDPQIEARAMRLYPNASQQDERNKFIAAEQSRTEELQNKIDVRNAIGDFGVKKEEVKAKAGKEIGAGHDTAKVQAAQQYSQARIQQGLQRLQAQATHDEAVNGRTALNARIRQLVSKVSTGQKLDPQEQRVWDANMQGTTETAQPAAPQAPQRQAPAQSSGQPPVPGAKFYKGQWYTRGPNGESVPVQQ